MDADDASRCVVGEGVDSQLIYRDACNVTFNDFLTDNLIIVGAVGIAFGLFEVSLLHRLGRGGEVACRM